MPFSGSFGLLPRLHLPIFTGVAFPAIFLLSQMRRTVAEAACQFAFFSLSIFPYVRGPGIVAELAVQFTVRAGQGKGGMVVIEAAVAVAACAGDIFILDRLDNLSFDGQPGKRVTLAAADAVMKQLQ